VETHGPDRDEIVNAALALAEQAGWESVRLHDVADSMGIDLETIRSQFREKDDIAEAWFDRADRGMLVVAGAPGFSDATADERVQRLIFAWLDRLSVHRRVTRQIILGKLEFGHLHVQIPALLRISRTVQWLREAAARDATGLARALDETGLTAIFVTTFVRWLADDSPDSRATHQLLSRLMRSARCCLPDSRVARSSSSRPKAGNQRSHPA
jgi:AcrR family transcriptional regulator